MTASAVLTESLLCRHGDARCNASRFLAGLSSRDKKNACFAYGNEKEVLVCIGKQVEPAAQPSHDPFHSDDHWQAVHDVFEHHGDHYVFGFLGFAFGLVDSSEVKDRFPPCWFGKADIAIRFKPNSSEILHGDIAEMVETLGEIKACFCQQKNVELVAALDKSSESNYLMQVEQALSWVHREQSRRMTVARRVPLPSVDLLQTFYCQPSHNTLSKSFYLDIGSAAFVGKCPEVLLEWTEGKFDAYKLSGTYPKDKNPETDAGILEQFLADPKIIAEHKLSADGFGAGVAKVGEVSRQGPNVLDLDRLRHMMTAFSVKTTPGTSLTDCLRAVLPPGVSPFAEGLPALLAIENAKRGPYYGLVGMYSPNRKASFTQILRSVFQQDGDCYAWVGAAVTQGSTAKGELEESKLKLSDIVVTLE